ncbi:probable DNA mismatch repair protein Msh6 [Phlebotomus argentipes]|uniref:probable DNA mismatch repair protein Msh6 n=1 Tax=Phlebotomus argentipes TaxID=94469 RepID=UPI0028929F69|nr:probable DNA mismatch repair protein Msh6 [Phlebotomus argentipes]
MSKRSGDTPKNTLFNYFNRTPPVSGGSGKFTSKTPSQNDASPSTPKTATSGLKSGKRILSAEKSSLTPKNPGKNVDDEVLTQKKKRRRIITSDSEDSDQENESPKSNPEKRLPVSPLATPMGAKKVKKEITETPKLSIEEKLASLTKSEPNEIPDMLDSTAIVEDQDTVWLHNKLDFIKPENIRDIKKRKPDHPEYDGNTVFVPDSFMKTLTPAMYQWWGMKSQHYDCVLLFKVGKFYELYHMDAVVGVNEIGLSFMKGDFAHSGFPEQAYDRMATSLVEKGYKVARVEQTETPDMVQERCKKQKGVTKFDKVSRREICQITNRGTRVFGQQVQLTGDFQPQYMLAIVEVPGGISSTYGICFIDTSIGLFHIGQFEDDKHSSRMLTLLAHYTPVLVLFQKNTLSDRTKQIYKTMLGSALKDSLSEAQMWDASTTLKNLAEQYFHTDEGTNWPEIFKEMQDDCDHLGLTPKKDYALALKALGGCIFYLSRCLLDQQILSLARYEFYIPPDTTESIAKLESDISKDSKKLNRSQNMVLDSITLQNLRITGEEGSLKDTLDHCCTKFGKRLLHNWLCSPSCNISLIRKRQEAVTELLDRPILLQDIRILLGSLSDLERQLAQIHSFSSCGRFRDHPDSRAILYEETQYSKKKIQDFIFVLNGFKSLLRLPEIAAKCSSELLISLTQNSPVGSFPDFSEILDFFQKSFDHEVALKSGFIAPERGVDAEYDAIENEITDIETELKEYVKVQEKYFNCKISVGANKSRFQLEIPEAYAKKAGSEYSLEGQQGKKKRYHTDETRDLVKRITVAEDQKKVVLKDLMRRIFEKFSNNHDLWKQCVSNVAILDVLTSLAEYARNSRETCVPEIIEGETEPLMEIEDGYHPCLASNEDFIPNGVILGAPRTAMTILTGPNMGGKSTLMRQVGLLAVMAQIGSRIPATRCRMSLIDRIFTRLGAQDDILAGHSTFLVELSETSAILKHATVNSLVLLDELGRGTATYDGTAIAASVVNFLTDLRCRTLFSTHYHSLVDNFHGDERITLGHMACMVENEDSDDPTQETVTFLYKYADGPCPKSYGFNAAKLAGMPVTIIRRAHELSKKVESNALKRQIFSRILSTANVEEIRNLLSKLKAFGSSTP